MSSKVDLLKKQIADLQAQLEVEMAKSFNVSDGTLPTCLVVIVVHCPRGGTSSSSLLVAFLVCKFHNVLFYPQVLCDHSCLLPTRRDIEFIIAHCFPRVYVPECSLFSTSPL